jgi:hypothetical protein
MSKLALVFGSRDEGEDKSEQQTGKLYAQIGQLKGENDFLKKKLS